jgi:uncharacterized protein (DUF58 family)
VARSRTAAGGARFLDPAVLSRIGNLELLARTVVDGFLTGLHRSPYLGFSTDFAEHRAYMPGDDVRRIDWRLFARTDRHYIKLFEAETNANVAILLDVSSSMSYASHEVSKLDYGRYLSACLGYMSNRQRDRVGLITFDHELVEYLPPSMRPPETMLHLLDRVDAGRPGRLGPPLLRATELLGRKGIVMLLSDLYEDPADILSAVGPLRARGHDVIVFHILDPKELSFSFEGASGFEDLETGEQIPVVPERMRAGYRKLMDEHLEAVGKRFSDNRIDYVLLDTSKPLDEGLFRYLLARERLRSAR